MLRQNKLLLWLLAFVLIAACAPVFSAAPALPTLDASAINTLIAQTAAAASSQTAEALPPTVTASPLPSTPTPVSLLLFNSPTVSPLLFLTSTPHPSGSKDYACYVLKRPLDGTTYAPRTGFNAVWLLQNTGRKIWESEAVVFIYTGGDRFHKTASYNLKKSLEFGETAEFSVEMQAPKNPGTYTTLWALQSGDEIFCNVSLTIIVKE